MKQDSLWQKFITYINPYDDRYEELKKGNIALNIADDITAGFKVALVAIPLAIGFAMASGLRPEQGLIGGAVAGLLGSVFGGSKYMVYGPAAAFIPVIGGLMATYNHGFLVLASIGAGLLLLLSGFFKLGARVKKIPRSIVVGFTAGIAIIIIFSQLTHVLGIKGNAGYYLLGQLNFVFQNIHHINLYAVTLAVMTIIFCRAFEKLSSTIPGLMPALIFGYLGAQTFWSQKGLIFIADQYGTSAFNNFVFTAPLLPETWSLKIVIDLCFYSCAFFTIAAIESLVCGHAADRLAANKGLPFNPDRELRGQGIMNMFAPLFNGFPYTGTLGRTALNIRAKGSSPLAGMVKSIFKIVLAVLFARYIAKIPMASIGGVLLYAASGMIKRREIKEILHMNNYHVTIMFYTLIAVPLFGFMTGVVSALIVYAIFYRLFEKKKNNPGITRKPGDETRIVHMRGSRYNKSDK